VKTICAWHDSELVLANDGVADGRVSDGICPECAANLLANRKARDECRRLVALEGPDSASAAEHDQQRIHDTPEHGHLLPHKEE